MTNETTAKKRDCWNCDAEFTETEPGEKHFCCHDCETQWMNDNPNPNTNCLEGIRCPKCGHTASFNIQATCMVYVQDDGTDDSWDYEWDDDSFCQCRECDHHSVLKEFREENQKGKEQCRPTAD